MDISGSNFLNHSWSCDKIISSRYLISPGLEPPHLIMLPFTSAGATVALISVVDSLLCPARFWIIGTGTPAIRAPTIWLCLRIWGVTFFLESFCLGGTSRIPASSVSRSMVRNSVLVLR
ncbi:Uncharacterised protein [uncultured archaeon]|nr:Uncharacterised protein [uncultured archaeon]